MSTATVVEDQDAAPTGATTPAAVRPPRWFDLVALTGPVVVAALGSVGLLLAILGVYSTWLTVALGGPAAIVMLAGVWRVAPDPGPSSEVVEDRAATRRRVHGPAVAAVLLAVGFMVFAGSVPSQNVIATRDPGVYMNTARWLSQDGDLDVDAKEPAFAGVADLQFESAGAYDMGGGDVEFQFNHLASVVMSVGYDLGGYRVLFRTPALAGAAGLLALYAVAVRVTRRPVVALIAPALLALSMPMLYVSRNTYSEPFAFALLWGAALAIADLHRRPRMTTALVGGVILGALVSTRIDALLYVALVFPLAAMSIISPTVSAGLRRARARSWLVVVAAAAIVGSIGIIDLLEWTGRYAHDLSPQLTMLRLAVAAAAVASVGVVVIWRFVPVLRTVYDRLRRPLAIAAAAGVVAVMLVGWLVRPLVQVVRSRTDYEVVRNIQKAEGLLVDGHRIYSEDSLRWMAWYLGRPALAAAIIGMGILLYRGIRKGSITPAAVGVLGLTLAAGAMYWWKPSITPDHLWATRRFVPAVLPGLALLAIVPVAAVLERSRPDRRVRHGVVAVLALALLIPPAVTTWPVRWQRDQYGYLNPVLEACDLLPENAAVVVLGGYAGATLSQTVRSWCEVPVAGQGIGLNADTVERVAEKVSDNGYQLAILSADSRDFDSFLPVLDADPRATNSAADHWLVQRTLDRVPDSYVPYERSLPVEIPFRLHVLVVDAG